MDSSSQAVLANGSSRDRELLDRVWLALQRQPVIRALDLGHMSVAVCRERVSVGGHVRSKRLIEDTVAGIPGVRRVHSELVADQELIAATALGLARFPRTQRYRLRVEADHGWLRLLGEVPSWNAQDAVALVAGAQPAVRGVLQLPAVTGESAGVRRRPVQPPTGAEVAGAERLYGRLAHVIIDPACRLVTHIVVEVDPEKTGPMGAAMSNLVVIPSREIRQVGSNTVYLHRDSGPLNTYPYFNSADFLPPPPAWRAPFPYERGVVRWQREAWRRTKRQVLALFDSEAVEDGFTTRERSAAVAGAA
jgi:hypothetical protein